MEISLTEQNITIERFGRYVRDNRYRMVPQGTSYAGLELLAVSNAFGGEAGELQNIVKKIIRENVLFSDSDLHAKFVLEAGDALHYLISLIQLAGYPVEHVMYANVRKLEMRKDEAQHQALVLAKASVKS